VNAEHNSVPPGPERLSEDYAPQNVRETCQNTLLWLLRTTRWRSNTKPFVWAVEAWGDLTKLKAIIEEMAGVRVLEAHTSISDK
jgi:hypothetical protein